MQQKILEELKQKNNDLSILFSNSTDGIVLVKEGGIIVDVNKEFENIFGYCKEECIGKKLNDLIVDKKMLKEAEEFDIKSMEVDRYAVETVRKAKDGRKVDVVLKSITIFPENGKKDLYGYVLYTDITQKKDYERQLKSKLEFQTILSDISSKLVNTHPKDFDESIYYMLKVCGNFFDVDRGYLFQFNNEEESLKNTHEWCRMGIPSRNTKSKTLNVSKLPWWSKKILNMTHVYVNDVDLLPKEAEAGKKHWQNQGIKSLLTIPVEVEKEVIGLFGFHSLKKKKEWSEDQIHLLKIISGLVSGAIAKNNAYEKLVLSENRIKEQYNKLSKLYNNIEKIAYQDHLTGLGNRRAIMKEELNDKIKSSFKMGALLLIDIDQFRYINDTMGHSYGDIFLKKVTELLKANTSNSDRIFRIGGDEFVILTSFYNQKNIGDLIRNLLFSFRAPIKLNGSTMYSSISIGVAFYPKDGKDIETLLRNADVAMHKAKKNGRGNCVRFNEDITNEILEKVSIDKYLKTAIKNDEFNLNYQPQIMTGVNKECIWGFEALLRWESPSLGNVPPSKFIKCAEDSHLIVPIGNWVFEKACKFVKNIHKIGYKNIRISVNISVVQLVQNDFETFIIETLKKYELPYHSIELEITESVLIESLKIIYEKLQRLRKLGVRIALDDFGKGYSSLTYLRKLSIDTLKIDKSFVDDILDSGFEKSLVGSVIKMGRQMNLEVVAEGIESFDQFSYLKDNECDRFQGYYFSKPISENKVIEYLKD